MATSADVGIERLLAGADMPDGSGALMPVRAERAEP